MKPYWIGYKIVAVGSMAYEKYRCNQCNKKCQISVPINKEPPTECGKGVKDDSNNLIS